jgi:hypothetical protein
MFYRPKPIIPQTNNLLITKVSRHKSIFKSKMHNISAPITIQNFDVFSIAQTDNGKNY